MKKLLNTFLLMLLLSGVVACRSDLNSDLDGNHRSQRIKDEPIKKTIHMSFGGDFISQSEEPLLRADDGETFTGINVFRSKKKDNGTFEAEERYAYGLFKGIDNISVEVLTGYAYRFEASVLIEREDKLFINDDYAYTEPFYRKNTNDASLTAYDKSDLQKFIYTEYETIDGELSLVDNDERDRFVGLTDGLSCVNTGDDTEQGILSVKYPRVKRFYGTVETFDPAVADIVEVDMGYRCFGLSFEVESLPSGHITVSATPKSPINNDNIHQNLVFPTNLKLSAAESNKKWSGAFSMGNLLAASETFDVTFTWHKPGNEIENYTTQVTVKPKVNKILKLNLTGTSNQETKGNIVITLDSVELTDETESISHDYDSK